MSWAVTLPLELTVCGTVIQYWAPDTSVAIWVTVSFHYCLSVLGHVWYSPNSLSQVFLVAIIFVNIFGTLGYAEEEFWAALLKLSATVIFMIVAIVLVCGGGPSNGLYHSYWGARLWYNPGAFQNGFRGFCGTYYMQ